MPEAEHHSQTTEHLAIGLLGSCLGGGPTSKLAIARSLSQMHQVLAFWHPGLASLLQGADVAPELYAGSWA